MADQARRGIFSPMLQRQRMAAALPLLQGRVLDFGCGNGALAEYITPSTYLGLDCDLESIDAARQQFAEHRFDHLGERFDWEPLNAQFDTVVLLALIEHIPDPRQLLLSLKRVLKSTGKIVLTTPSPLFGPCHTAGAMLGLFSREASEEHQPLIGRGKMQQIAAGAGLRLVDSKRFLCGANQLFVVQHAESMASPLQPGSESAAA